MQTRTITIALPSDIPDPRFQMFQRVSFTKEFCSSNAVEKEESVITGIEYVSVANALAQGLDCHGWSYSVLLNPPLWIWEEDLVNDKIKLAS